MTAPTLTAYAGPADLQFYDDWREIGELISDSNETISANDQLTNVNVIRSLNRGAGDIEANLLVSGMYTVAQLQGVITGGGNGAELLIGMNCELAYFYLYSRKPLYNVEKLEAFRKIREEHLKYLKTGVNVFNISANINAGTPEAKGLSTIGYSFGQSGLISDPSRSHYFPARSNTFGNG